MSCQILITLPILSDLSQNGSNKWYQACFVRFSRAEILDSDQGAQIENELSSEFESVFG